MDRIERIQSNEEGLGEDKVSRGGNVTNTLGNSFEGSDENVGGSGKWEHGKQVDLARTQLQRSYYKLWREATGHSFSQAEHWSESSASTTGRSGAGWQGEEREGQSKKKQELVHQVHEILKEESQKEQSPSRRS